MNLDPLAFRGTAEYYTAGRPPYSPHLAAMLVEALGLDGTGRLLDVGCGPGVVAVTLAPYFAEVVGLDPEPGMLAEGKRQADAAGRSNLRWVEGLAEQVSELDLAPCRVVTFGQSFHRVDRLAVAEQVYDLLAPGGAIAIITHVVTGRPRPAGTGHPLIPYDAIRELIISFQGDETRQYLDFWSQPGERFEDTLAKTRFGRPQMLYSPGVTDLVNTVDSLVAMYFSMSYAAPHRFGDRRLEFETALRRLLYQHSPEGLFWQWPGDTEIVLAFKS
jgi:SAM-dependent methyltransferase